MAHEINQHAVRNMLQNHLTSAQLKNPAFSVRSFSRRLKISHSALSEILNGKRKVGDRLSVRIADALLLDDEARGQFYCDRSSSVTKHAAASLALKADEFKVIADWFHFAILSLAETSDFSSDIGWIAQRLRCSATEARLSVDRLLRLGLLRKVRSKLRLSRLGFTTSDGIPDTAVRRSHSQYLLKAQESLECDSVESRDFTTMTMAIDPMKLPEARIRIRKFRDELCAFLESDQKKEVYQLGIQLIPVSKEI